MKKIYKYLIGLLLCVTIFVVIHYVTSVSAMIESASQESIQEKAILKDTQVERYTTSKDYYQVYYIKNIDVAALDAFEKEFISYLNRVNNLMNVPDQYRENEKAELIEKLIEMGFTLEETRGILSMPISKLAITNPTSERVRQVFNEWIAEKEKLIDISEVRKLYQEKGYDQYFSEFFSDLETARLTTLFELSRKLGSKTEHYNDLTEDEKRAILGPYYGEVNPDTNFNVKMELEVLRELNHLDAITAGHVDSQFINLAIVKFI